MIKAIAAVALGIVIYVVLGAYLPVTNATALLVVCLGTLGAFSYKGLVAVAAMAAVAKRI